MDRKFLNARSNHHSRMATRYDELFRLCEGADYVVLSGDVEMLEDYESLGHGDMQPTYWPVNLGGGLKDAGIIEIRHKDLGWIGRVSVHADGFYGTTIVGGNHDLNMSELAESLRKSVEAKRIDRDENLRLMA